MTRMAESRRGVLLVWGLIATIVVAGCAATRERRGAPPESGFLGDYSQLAKNPDYAAALVYVKPNVPWSRYDAIQFESAGLYVTESNSKLSPEDQERLAGMLYTTLSSELDKYFRLVSGPGANTLRLRVALTQAQGAKVGLRTVTTVVPQLRLVSTIGGLATDTAATVGSATVEMELQDSVSGERLAAAVDDRAGTKALFAKRSYQEWGDVQAAIDFWSKRLTWRLAKAGVQLKPGATMPEKYEQPRSF